MAISTLQGAGANAAAAGTAATPAAAAAPGTAAAAAPGAAAGKANQRVVLTKRLLREALIDLLATKPLAEVSVSELCAKAGINRSTFYSHYGNVTDILSEMAEEHLTVISTRLCALSEHGEVSIAQRVEVICAYLREHADSCKPLFASRAEVSPFAQQLLRVDAADSPAVDAYLSGYDAETRALLLAYISEGTYSLMRHWLLEDSAKTPAEMGKLAESVALHGWAAR